MKKMYFGSEVKATSGQVFNGFHQVIYLSIFNALKYHDEDVDEDKTRFHAISMVVIKSLVFLQTKQKVETFCCLRRTWRVLKKYLLKNYEI